MPAAAAPRLAQLLGRYAAGGGPAGRLAERAGEAFPVGRGGRVGQQELAGREGQDAEGQPRKPLAERPGGVRREAGEDVEELEARRDARRARAAHRGERQHEPHGQHAADGRPGLHREQGAQGRQDQGRGQRPQHHGDPLTAGAGDG